MVKNRKTNKSLQEKMGEIKMLLPVLYCVIFFILPTLGMISLARQKNGKSKEINHSEGSIQDKGIHRDRQSKQPVLSTGRVLAYQLIESHNKVPLGSQKRKGKALLRAGP